MLLGCCLEELFSQLHVLPFFGQKVLRSGGKNMSNQGNEISSKKNNKSVLSVELENDTIYNRRLGKACLISTKRGTEVAWRFKKEMLSWLQKDELYKEIYILCRKSFCVEDTPEFKSDIRSHVFDTHEICIVPFGDVPEGLSPTAFKTNRIAAFASYIFLEHKGEKLIYFSGIVVDPSLQRLNYGSLLIKEAMKSNAVRTAVLRTQNPVMYNSFAKVCEVFPSFDKKKIPEKIKDVGIYVAKNILNMRNYNTEEMTEERTYHRQLYGIEPVLENQMLENAFKQRINMRRGDSVIVVGAIK